MHAGGSFFTNLIGSTNLYIASRRDFSLLIKQESVLCVAHICVSYECKFQTTPNYMYPTAASKDRGIWYSQGLQRPAPRVISYSSGVIEFSDCRSSKSCDSSRCSIPHVSSNSECSGSPFMISDTRKPNPQIPIITSQMTMMLSANASRTKVRVGSGSVLMRGTIVKANDRPPGNSSRNSGGRRWLNCVCKIAAPIDTPHACTIGLISGCEMVIVTLLLTAASDRQKPKNASAYAFWAMGNGANTGK